MRKLFCILSLLLTCCVYSQRNNYVLAENYFRNSEYEKATLLYQNLLKKSPYNSKYLERLTTCYQQSSQFEKAEQLLRQKIAAKPKQLSLLVLLGHNFERQQQQQQAEENYQKALSKIKKHYGYGGAVAKTFKAIGKIDLAIKAYQETQKYNKGAQYGFQIAQLYGEKGEFAPMFDAYINYLDSNKRYLNNVKRYTAKYVNDDPENENNILFKKALLRRSASNPKNEWNDLLAWLFTKQKQYSKALIQHKALFTRNPDYLEGIRNLGKIAFKAKEYQSAKECFDFVIKHSSYPKDKFHAIATNMKIAIATNQPDIEEQFQNVFNEYGINKNTFDVQLAYANFLTFQNNQPQKAKEVLEKAMQYANSKFEKARVKIKLGETLVFQNRFNKALIYFSQVQTQFKNNPTGQLARFKVAQTSYFKNDFDWAKAQLKVLKGSATQLTANDAANLFLTISDNQIKDSIPTGLTKYAKANLLAYQNKTEESIDLLSQIITEFKGQAIEDEALFSQAKQYIKQEQFDKALDNFKAVIDIDKQGIKVDDSLYQMAKIFEKRQEIDKAKEFYQKIIFEHPSSIYLVDARKKFRELRGDSLNTP